MGVEWCMGCRSRSACNMLHCVAACCSMLHCVAACCTVLQVAEENERMELAEWRQSYSRHRKRLRVLAGEKFKPRKDEEVAWTVTVVTANCKGAGTDSRVMITLCGEYGESGPRQLHERYVCFLYAVLEPGPFCCTPLGSLPGRTTACELAPLCALRRTLNATRGDAAQLSAAMYAHADATVVGASRAVQQDAQDPVRTRAGRPLLGADSRPWSAHQGHRVSGCSNNGAY
jgi:hypothetical protein